MPAILWPPSPLSGTTAAAASPLLRQIAQRLPQQLYVRGGQPVDEPGEHGLGVRVGLQRQVHPASGHALTAVSGQE
ncbi:hypothetical protein ACFZDJ_34285 [Streptomyces sp. NPDC007896]|uniref:hypothetical protein n=1 Tax=Streptomyces sp. NPDC007896 TaxID=3364784 RepID=UPI0036E645CA